MGWGCADIPRLNGRSYVVTGANSGLGYHTALEFARHGGQVILACRNVERGETAVRRIRQEAPDARLEVMALDLGDLASVRAFVQALGAHYPRIAGLVNNAGVMAIPRATTADGFEMQLGVNHLGHFALTGLLLPRLLHTDGARVVTLTSMVHLAGRMRFDDLQSERRYDKWAAYSQSKLANALFGLELDRRLRAAGAAARSVVCHPGYAATNLQHVGPRLAGSALMAGVMRLSNSFFAQSAASGALPSLYAATASEVQGGQLIGPRVLGYVGAPRVQRAARLAYDTELAARLWDVSCELTGVVPAL